MLMLRQKGSRRQGGQGWGRGGRCRFSRVEAEVEAEVVGGVEVEVEADEMEAKAEEVEVEWKLKWVRS